MRANNVDPDKTTVRGILIRVFTACNILKLGLSIKYHTMVKPLSLNFRVFTVKLVGVHNLGTLQYTGTSVLRFVA